VLNLLNHSKELTRVGDLLHVAMQRDEQAATCELGLIVSPLLGMALECISR
jgi:hypothetical protein